MPMHQYTQSFAAKDREYKVRRVTSELFRADKERFIKELNNFVDRNHIIDSDAEFNFVYLKNVYHKNMAFADPNHDCFLQTRFPFNSNGYYLSSELQTEFDAFLERLEKFKSDVLLISKGLTQLLESLQEIEYAERVFPSCLVKYLPKSMAYYPPDTNITEASEILVKSDKHPSGYVDILPMIEAYSVANMLM